MMGFVAGSSGGGDDYGDIRSVGGGGGVKDLVATKYLTSGKHPHSCDSEG